MGEKPGSGDDEVITHGICGDCISNLELQEGAELSLLLESVSEAVLVLDDDGDIQGMSKKAGELLRIDHQAFTKKPPGMVFECPHARNPAGCRHTIHCSGCTIRMAIQETARTGKSVVRRPATVKETDATAGLLITTEKTGRMVLLRIEYLAQE